MKEDMNNNNEDFIKRLGFQRTTKFSIDDILRPEFGRRRTDNRLRNLYTKYNHILSRVTAPNPYECCLSGLACSSNDIACSTGHRSNTTESEDESVSKRSFSRPSRDKDEKHSNTNLKIKPRRLRDDSAADHRATEASCRERIDDRALPDWVYCTRYSDRPSSGPRSRKKHRKPKPDHEKRPRTSFTSDQLKVLQTEFGACRYLTENRRHNLASDLCLNESQIKIWFQNKRAKAKKRPAERSDLPTDLSVHRQYRDVTSYQKQHDPDTDNSDL